MPRGVIVYRYCSRRVLPGCLALVLALDPLLPAADAFTLKSYPRISSLSAIKPLWGMEALMSREAFFRLGAPHRGSAIFRALAPVRNFARPSFRLLVDILKYPAWMAV